MSSAALWLLGAYNTVVFAVYALDKLRARKGWWRTSEATLLWMAALMGGLGALSAIHLLHHKTRKPKFTWGVGAMTVAQAALLWWGARQGVW